VRALTTVTYKKGDVIFRQGDMGGDGSLLLMPAPID